MLVRVQPDVNRVRKNPHVPVFDELSREQSLGDQAEHGSERVQERSSVVYVHKIPSEGHRANHSKDSKQQECSSGSRDDVRLAAVLSAEQPDVPAHHA